MRLFTFGILLSAILLADPPVRTAGVTLIDEQLIRELARTLYTRAYEEGAPPRERINAAINYSLICMQAPHLKLQRPDNNYLLLMRYLQGNDPTERIAALEALSPESSFYPAKFTVFDTSLALAIQKSIEHPDPLVRRSAIRALPTYDYEKGLEDKGWRELRYEDIADPIKRAWGNETNSENKALLIHRLAGVLKRETKPPADDKVTALFLEGLLDNDPHVRKASTKAMASIQSPRPKLLSDVAHAATGISPEVRAAAFETLDGWVHENSRRAAFNEYVLPVLAKSMDRFSSNEKAKALSLFASSKAMTHQYPELEKWYLDALKTADQNELLIRSGKWGLLSIKLSEPTVVDLASRLSSPNSFVRECAIDTLRRSTGYKLSGPLVSLLINHLESDSENAANLTANLIQYRQWDHPLFQRSLAKQLASGKHSAFHLLNALGAIPLTDRQAKRSLTEFAIRFPAVSSSQYDPLNHSWTVRWRQGLTMRTAFQVREATTRVVYTTVKGICDAGLAMLSGITGMR